MHAPLEVLWNNVLSAAFSPGVLPSRSSSHDAFALAKVSAVCLYAAASAGRANAKYCLTRSCCNSSSCAHT
eukprot:SAG11_NODE_771_length_7253_cov_2.635741_5_plen_71_part_00